MSVISDAEMPSEKSEKQKSKEQASIQRPPRQTVQKSDQAPTRHQSDSEDSGSSTENERSHSRSKSPPPPAKSVSSGKANASQAGKGKIQKEAPSDSSDQDRIRSGGGGSTTKTAAGSITGGIGDAENKKKVLLENSADAGADIAMEVSRAGSSDNRYD